MRPEVNHLLDALIDCQWAEAFRPFGVGAARTPNDDQLQSITACWIASHQLGNGLDQYVGCLERLDAANEQDHLNVLSHTELGTRLRLVARMKSAQIDARRHDHDVPFTRAVVTAEFGRLVPGACGKHVGSMDDGSLTALPHVWFGRLASSEVGVLHPSHGVHGVHQREATPLLQLQTDYTGE